MFLKYVGHTIKLLKNNLYYTEKYKKLSDCIKTKLQWRILFFGSDEFSLASLESLNNAYRSGKLISDLEVVTKSFQKSNPIYCYAKKNNLIVHKWPITSNLIKNKYNIGIVVSFGNLIPAKIINAFPWGMLNVHASLLPRWRGAAPIIHALAAGDTETGVTIMKIKPEKFDTGDIIRQKKVVIRPETTQPELTQQLSILGAETLIETLRDAPEYCIPQSSVGITYARRIQVEFSRIYWQTMTSTQIINLYRALKGLYPLHCHWMDKQIKIFKISPCNNVDLLQKENQCPQIPGSTIYCKKDRCLKTLCCDNKWIRIDELSVSGKPVMTSQDFYNGYMSKSSAECYIFT